MLVLGIMSTSLSHHEGAAGPSAASTMGSLKVAPSLITLPTEILDQIICYCLPKEVWIGLIDARDTTSFLALIRTHSLLSRLTIRSLYTTSLFVFNLDRFINTFLLTMDPRYLKLIRRASFIVWAPATPYLEDLLTAQDRGLALKELELRPQDPDVTSEIVKGSARPVVLQLRGLKAFDMSLTFDEPEDWGDMEPVAIEEIVEDEEIEEFERLILGDNSLISATPSLKVAQESSQTTEERAFGGAPTLVTLPAHILRKVISYLIPEEIRLIRTQAWPLEALRPFCAIILTHSLLSRLAIHSLYTTALFKITSPHIGDFLLRQLDPKYLKLIRRIRCTVGPAFGLVWSFVGTLVEAQEKGMRLEELELFPTTSAVTAEIVKGSGREEALKLRGLKKFKIYNRTDIKEWSEIIKDKYDGVCELECLVIGRTMGVPPCKAQGSSAGDMPLTSSRVAVSLLTLPIEILDQIISYVIPGEIQIDWRIRPGHRGFDPRCSSPAVQTFYALIRTHTLLSRLAIHSLYTRALFFFPDQNAAKFLLTWKYFKLIRRARFIPASGYAGPFLLRDLLRAQDKGVALKELELETYYPSALVELIRGPARSLVLQLRGLKKFKIYEDPIATRRWKEPSKVKQEEIDELERLVLSGNVGQAPCKAQDQTSDPQEG